MKAVILAGGEGSRLRPLTFNRPAPMIPVVDRPLIQHTIELLKLHGIIDIIIAVQYLANSIQDYYGDGSAFGVNITYSLEEAPLGTAGSVKHAEHLLRAEPFLVISGDILTDVNLTQIIDHHYGMGAMATLTLTRVANPIDYGVIITDDKGNVRQFLEKPSWGEIFSDTVSSKIYVLKPEVLGYIERGKASSWARDIFPHMLRKGDRLQGYIAGDYWADLSTLDEYMRVCGDYLMGRINLPRLGKNIGGDIWVDGDAEIAPDAQLHGPIYLGHGAKIRGGVIIHGPSVIRDYTIVDTRANIDRSVIWRNSYIGERAELRGAIVLRQSNIRARAMLFESAVVGDGAQIGAGAVIQPGVKIWPSKEVEDGAVVNSSLIWGSQGRRALFGRYGITGMVNIEITPELCTRFGAAYGSTLSRNTAVLINSEDHYTPRMLAGAIRSGLVSAGISVLDLKGVPFPVTRYLVAQSDLAGGIQVRLSPTDNRVIEIKLFDEYGLDIDSSQERAIERVYYQEDHRRAYLDEIGRVQETHEEIAIYLRDFFAALAPAAVEAIADRFNLVIASVSPAGNDLLSQVLRHLGCDLLEFFDQANSEPFVTTVVFESIMASLSQTVFALRADFGVYIDRGGEKLFLVDDRGQRVSSLRALLAMTEMAMRAKGGGAVAVPVSAPRAFDQVAARYGGQIIRARATPNALMQLAFKQRDLLLLGDGTGQFIFPTFYPIVDAVFTAVKLMELLVTTGSRLSDVLADLPPYYLAQLKVPCRWESKGKVMRILNEQYANRQVEQVDGIKIELGGEWVLILPDPDSPFFHIIAEGAAEEQARVLVEKYAGLVSGLQ